MIRLLRRSFILKIKVSCVMQDTIFDIVLSTCSRITVEWSIQPHHRFILSDHALYYIKYRCRVSYQVRWDCAPMFTGVLFCRFFLLFLFTYWCYLVRSRHSDCNREPASFHTHGLSASKSIQCRRQHGWLWNRSQLREVFL